MIAATYRLTFISFQTDPSVKGESERDHLNVRIDRPVVSGVFVSDSMKARTSGLSRESSRVMIAYSTMAMYRYV